MILSETEPPAESTLSSQLIVSVSRDSGFINDDFSLSAVNEINIIEMKKKVRTLSKIFNSPE